jgi:outer membrane protein
MTGRAATAALGMLALLGAALPAPAEEALRLGYVNVVKVIEQAPQGESVLKKLEAEFGPRDKQLRALRDRIKALEEELEKNALAQRETDRAGKERELADLRRNLKRDSQEFREDYNVRRNEELGALQKIVYQAIVQVAKEEKYDLVIHEGAVYAGDRVDITDKVLNRLRAKKP